MYRGCNAGFIRDDALHVIVIITDEDEGVGIDNAQGSAGDPGSWFNKVKESSGGYEENSVVLGLIGPPGADACPAYVKGTGQGAEKAPTLNEFINKFTNNLTGPVCLPNYDSFFLNAVKKIDKGCRGFKEVE